ncbi:hypothetical protein TNCV_3303561 [Trichonephila clavipes]|nr:hypothetical protein TNCV_3303561 [Trichonephila clavipes]
MGNLEIKKRGRDSLRRLLHARTRRGLPASDTNFSLELPGSPQINENEGGLRTEKVRVNDSTVEIELASSHKLGEELPNGEDFL